MKIVIIASFFPYPAHFGGAFDVLERVKGLHSLGHIVDLVCTCKKIPKKEELNYLNSFVNQVYMVPRKNKVIQLFSHQPIQVVSRKSLKEVNLSQEYDVAILESESVGFILQNKSFKYKKLCLRVHNNESKYFYQLGQSTPNLFKKFYYYSESIKFKGYSNQLYKKVDRLWFISFEELKECNQLGFFSQKSIHLPTAQTATFRQQPLNNSTVLFVGSLFMPNNIKALTWYLQYVHPFMMEEKDYKFIIVGSTGDADQNSILSAFKKYNNVEVYLNQMDLQPFYKQSSIFINPMFYGTGVKLKSVNAIQNGLLLISTLIGAEGIGLTTDSMYLPANSPEEFIKSLQRVFKMSVEIRQEIVLNAQHFLRKNNFLSILKNELE